MSASSGNMYHRDPLFGVVRHYSKFNNPKNAVTIVSLQGSLPAAIGLATRTGHDAISERVVYYLGTMVLHVTEVP